VTRLRRATLDDAELLRDRSRTAMAEYAAFAPEGWTIERLAPDLHLERIQATLANPDAVVLISDDGRGHVAWRPEEDRAHLLALFVDREAWGTGLAKRLHDRALETMRERDFDEASLYTPAGQSRARRFYEREGWQRTSEPEFSDPFGLELVEYRRRVA
jgi:GNAT superfamily N-acetyltransferase